MALLLLKKKHPRRADQTSRGMQPVLKPPLEARKMVAPETITPGKQLTIIGIMFCLVSILGGRLEFWQVNWAAGIVGYPLVVFGVVRMMIFER